MQNKRRIFLASPGYGSQTAAAGRAIWHACRNMSEVSTHHYEGSLLAANFNAAWCAALNDSYHGYRVDYFAMIHDDVGAEDFWLDTLIDELEAKQLDVLGVAVPIKDPRGFTSLAIDGGGTWLPKCRITMQELYSLPETFTSDDVGGPLLLNTGCWVCKFDFDWCKKVHFTINDRIVFNTATDRYMSETEPEDWYFSRLCHELNLKIGATRKVAVEHRGVVDYSNRKVWGRSRDAEYGYSDGVCDLFPFDVEGWLTPDEGNFLTLLADGKDVLEIGSYAGRSSICIAKSAKSLACCDYFDGRGTAVPRSTFEDFTENIEKYNVTEKITVVNPDQPFLREAYDVVFIDGDHSKESVESDITRAQWALRDGGLIAFHDYQSSIDPGVTEAVDNLIASGAELLGQKGSVAVVRPKSFSTCLV